jgi:hypothetical protein
MFCSGVECSVREHLTEKYSTVFCPIHKSVHTATPSLVERYMWVCVQETGLKVYRTWYCTGRIIGCVGMESDWKVTGK